MAKHTSQDNIKNHSESKNKRLPYKLLLTLTALAMLLAACSQPTTAPTLSPSSTATEAPAPTQTSSPTPTPTETPEPTPTLTPTLEPLVLGNFSAQLEGVGTHGTMACYTYDGDAADLENLVLRANISQGDNVIESNITSQDIEDKTCFEMVDAKYESVDQDNGKLIIPEEPVTLLINATSQNKRAVENNNQTLDLGPYVQFPFLEWIYDSQQVCKVSGDSHKGYFAWDFLPYPTVENPTIIGTPIYAPIDGKAYVTAVSLTESGSNYTLMIFSPETGYLLELLHDSPVFISSEGEYKQIIDLDTTSITAGDVIASIGLKDTASTVPHTHMSLIPIGTMDLYDPASEVYSYFLYHDPKSMDFIKENLFLDDSVNAYLNRLPNSGSACQNFRWGTLPEPPQGLPFVIDGVADDWEDYTPVLTDRSGDSSAGDVMDLTQLYMAMDDNYLYLMVKAGKKPSYDWVIHFLLDSGSENTCGSAEFRLAVESRSSDSFSYREIENCDDFRGADYPGAEIIFSDVLEIRVPLLYIDRPDFKISQVWTYITDSAGNWTMTDTIQ